jgi:DUF971 family protein
MIQPPVKIHNARAHGCIIIHWPNGQEHIINYQQLRRFCRCASCRADTFQGKIPLIPQELHVEKINTLGPGLQFVFSDGHERGIFPWQYLFDVGTQLSNKETGYTPV